jgi:hypothetical protein
MKLLGDDKIDCTIRDDQYKTDVTKRNFEDFLDQGIVFYLNYSTGSTLALKKDFDEEKMPTIPASFHAGNLEGIPVTSFCPSPPIPPRPSAWPNIWPTTIKATGHLKWPCSCIPPLSAVAP